MAFKNGETSLNDMTFFLNIFLSKGIVNGLDVFFVVPDVFCLLFRGSKEMKNAMMQHVGCTQQLFVLFGSVFEKMTQW